MAHPASGAFDDDVGPCTGRRSGVMAMSHDRVLERAPAARHKCLAAVTAIRRVRLLCQRPLGDRLNNRVTDGRAFIRPSSLR